MPPPSIEPVPVRVELGPLRELLAVDRRGAGEARKAPSSVALTTAAYAVPLHVQWRRVLRRNRRLRVTIKSACLCMVAAVVFWQAPPWNVLRARAASWAKSASVMVHTLQTGRLPVGQQDASERATAP
jgi:hypothetical protein